ncbi:MAG: endonuclease III [Bacteroides sp.]|nr:MAG: endonuclease III [Bacteroides sp.]
MLIKERYKRFINFFKKKQPKATTELNYSNGFELLIAVVLSAQCTDKRVNIVTKNLFKYLKNPEDFSKVSYDKLYSYIKSISYPNNKTKYLIELSKIIINKFNGKVPNTIENLLKLPGIGRKSANVIGSTIYNIPVMAVDRHVMRVSIRLGLVSKKYDKNVLMIEQKLSQYIPKKYLSLFHNWLVLHGRYICLARNPKCSSCYINDICKFYNKKIKFLKKKY